MIDFVLDFVYFACRVVGSLSSTGDGVGGVQRVAEPFVGQHTLPVRSHSTKEHVSICSNPKDSISHQCLF